MNLRNCDILRRVILRNRFITTRLTTLPRYLKDLRLRIVAMSIMIVSISVISFLNRDEMTLLLSMYPRYDGRLFNSGVPSYTVVLGMNISKTRRTNLLRRKRRVGPYAITNRLRPISLLLTVNVMYNTVIQYNASALSSRKSSIKTLTDRYSPRIRLPRKCGLSRIVMIAQDNNRHACALTVNVSDHCHLYYQYYSVVIKTILRLPYRSLTSDLLGMNLRASTARADMLVSTTNLVLRTREDQLTFYVTITHGIRLHP